MPVSCKPVHFASRIQLVEHPGASPARASYRAIWVTIMLLVTNYPAVPCRAELPPVWVNGSIGLDYQLNQNEGLADRGNLGNLLNLNVNSYLIQPWIAQVSAGLSYKITNSEQEGASQDGESVSADARLRIFPMSKFPFELFYKRQGNDIENPTFDFNSSQTLYGFIQQYTTPGNMHFDLHYEHNDLDQDNANTDTLEVDEFDSLRFGVSRAVGNISLDFSNLYTDLVEKEIDSRTRNLYSILRHQYTPGSTLSVNGFQSLRESKFNLVSNKREIQRLELNEYMFWRPRMSKPLLFTATLRYLDATNSNELSSNNQQSLTASTGASYQLSDHWRVAGSASLTLQDQDEGNNSNGSQEIEARYESLEKNFKNGAYNWFASVGLRNEQEDDAFGNQKSLLGSVGHGFRRVLFQESVPINFLFNQRVNAIEASNDRSEQFINNSLSLHWNKQDASGTSLAMLTLSDSRSFGGKGVGNENRENQFANLQISRQHTINRMESWSGNITLQVSRQSSQQDQDSDFEPNVSIDISYINNRMFGVNRLRFQSSLEFYSESYLPFIDEPQDPTDAEGQSWYNRLNYTYGLLDFQLLARFTKARGTRNGLINLRVRRYFESNF